MTETTAIGPRLEGEATRVRAPKVSVLMPVYNAERYVAEATRSILDQTFGDFEFLIIDDGSTDGSRAILERFAAEDPRIRLISRPNTGYLVALNQMLALAEGELLARMDADDVARSDRFERQVRYLGENPDCVLVGSRVTVIDPDGRPLTVMSRALSHEEIIGGLLTGEGGQLVYHPSVMFRKWAVDEVGPYREEFYLCEDVEFFLRMAEVGRIVNLPETLVRYREHFTKVGRARVAQQLVATRRAIVEANLRRGLTPPAPPPDREARPFGRAEILRCWGWWALGSGFVGTARHYALAAVACSPHSRDSWRLLACAVRGR